MDKEDIDGALNQNHWGYKTLTDEFRNLYCEDVGKRKSLSELLEELVMTQEKIEIDEISALVETYIRERGERVDRINHEIEKIWQEYEGNINSFNDYWEDLTRKIRNAEDLISTQDNKESLVSLLDFYYKQDFSIFAEAGFGKTHFACSLAENRIEKGRPVLFLMGSQFRRCQSVESKIRELLNLSADLTLDDILDSLDFLASLYGCKLPIIIDGLNETAPAEDLWRNELPPFIRRIRERNHLVLVTTCREKEDYIQAIYDKKDFSEVENHIQLKGIALEDLKITTRRYFQKYNVHPVNRDIPHEFSNPLLLKVFCLTNRNRSGFNLDSYSLASCMHDYSDRLIRTIATKNGKEDVLAKHQIGDGLNKISQIIWNGNNRCLSLYDEFAPAFERDHLDGFLNEGMCFMLDRNDGEEQIQFSYDMVAGYHIAKSIIAQCATCEDFVKYVNGNKSKFYGLNRHTLAEDVIKSLFYCVPKKYGKQWLELMDDADIVLAGIDHLDIIVSEEDGRRALTEHLSKPLDSELKRKLLDALYLRALDMGNLSYLSLFIPLFLQLTQLEWDTLWYCKLAEYDPLLRAYSALHDKYYSERYPLADRLCLSAILCGVTDMEYRIKYHALLQELSWRDFGESKDTLQSLLYIHDTFVFESVLSVIAGAGLRSDQELITCESIRILESFLQTYGSNHIVLLDDLDTLYAYAEYKYQLTYDRKLLSKNSSEEWPVENKPDYKYSRFFSYDFDKYNIRPLYQNYGEGRRQLPAERIYGMLHARIASMGYDVSLYRKLENAEYERAKYRYSLKCTYSYKYGRYALMELYGWLIHHNYLKSVYKGTFRTEIVDIDPSSPRFMPMKTYINQFLLSRDIHTIDKWLHESSCMEVIANQNNVKLPKYEGKWVLLRGYLKQKSEDRCSNLFLSRACYLVPKEMTEAQIEKLDFDDSAHESHTFACELGWRALVNQDDYSNPYPSETLLWEYSFSSWDKTRFDYRNFYVLNTEIARRLGLSFDVQKMNYYLGDEEVSAYYVNETDHFFFLRKDILDAIKRQYKAKIVCCLFEERIVDEKLPQGAPEIDNKYVIRKSRKIIE
jgi:hypothetical protein